VRAHVTAVRLFLTWCQETGRIDSYRDRPLRRLLQSYPPTYGKVEAPYPALRLSQDGYDALVNACRDSTQAGMRDELMVRLAVSGGMRPFELLAQTVGTVRRAPDLAWKGKRNKTRTAVAGPILIALIHDYLTRYEQAVARPLIDADPLSCRTRHSRSRGALAWGEPITTTAAIRLIAKRRAARAGLGHMAPHDWKRTSGRMMHEARGADGGHLFDLLDIADVLDHSNPKVTKDCYIGPLGNANKERAAELFG
jgi:integrase